MSVGMQRRLPLEHAVPQVARMQVVPVCRQSSELGGDVPCLGPRLARHGLGHVQERVQRQALWDGDEGSARRAGGRWDGDCGAASRTCALWRCAGRDGADGAGGGVSSCWYEGGRDARSSRCGGAAEEKGWPEHG